MATMAWFHIPMKWRLGLIFMMNCTVLMYFVSQSYRMEMNGTQRQTNHRFVERVQRHLNGHNLTLDNITYFRTHQNATDMNMSQLLIRHSDLVLNTISITVYVITPTYTRGTQMPDLTRLAQTLMHVPKLHWIIVEDSPKPTQFVTDLLSRTRMSYTHLYVATPVAERKLKVRGCAQRNAALTWIKEHVTSGVFYFADDDNAYDLRLFDDIRDTQKVGLTPTGNLAKTGISSPIVKHGKVTGFVDVWKAGRKFPVEMASIVVNVKFWLGRGAPLFDNRKMGYLETRFLESMNIQVSDIEPKADGCTKIYTWHTNTVHVKVGRMYTKTANTPGTNIPKLLENVIFNS